MTSPTDPRSGLPQNELRAVKVSASGVFAHSWYDYNDRYSDLTSLQVNLETGLVAGTFRRPPAAIGDRWVGSFWLERGINRYNRFEASEALSVEFGEPGPPVVRAWNGTELVGQGVAEVELQGAHLVCRFPRELLMFEPNAVGMSAVAYPGGSTLSSYWLALLPTGEKLAMVDR